MFRVTALLVLMLLSTVAARAEILLTSRSTQVQSGGPIELQLTITNDADQALTIEIPTELHVRLDAGASTAVLTFEPSRSGLFEISPQQFARIDLKGVAPTEVSGVVALRTTGFDTNPVSLQITEPSAPTADGPGASALSDPKFDPLLVDKPPPLAISVYEPVYLVLGGDGGLNAKFQISLRYRLFDDRGRLAQRLTWLDDLYLSFSQTSLWDLDEISKPFKDSSYRPRLFYADYDIDRFLDGRLRAGLETGFGHESNGKEGAESRSFNMFYVRPTLTFGDPDGLRVWLAPMIHNYIADDENPDLKDYRGYVDWALGVGSKGGLDFWATLRNGERSDYGSVELNVSYPLSKLSGGDLTGWLLLQYFGGYGESLLDYNRKLDSQLRLGVAVAL